MAKQLSSEEIKDIPSLTNTQLLDEFEYFSDYKVRTEYLASLGKANKTIDDVDVKKTYDDYQLLKDEVVKRTPEENKPLIGALEIASNKITLNHPRYALLVENEEKTVKSDFNEVRSQLEKVLKWQ